MGGLGLNTGMLDADALAEALIMVLNEGVADQVLDMYSDTRRQVFGFFVDPMSTQNKLRVENHAPETASQTDGYLRILARGPTADEQRDMMKPFETWRTDIRAMAAAAKM